MTRSPMASHLTSRYTTQADMAEAAYWTIHAEGLRLPPRRVIAGMAKVSEATLSRRFKGLAAEEVLVLELVRARAHTYPPGWGDSGWEQWLPTSAGEIDDARVWSACQQLSPTSPAVAAAVVDVWTRERDRLARDHPRLEPLVLDALHALIVGLSLRRTLGSALEDRSAASALRLVAAALGAVP